MIVNNWPCILILCLFLHVLKEQSFWIIASKVTKIKITVQRDRRV